jgi:predicted enzyme related to lactoylglutathione lyase
MYLENLVFDSVEPQRLGRYWESLVGGERLTDEIDIFETRLAVAGGPDLDLCFQPVPEAPTEPLRVHLYLAAQVASVPEGSLSDPEGNSFAVVDDRPAYAGAGPLAAVRLDSADPDAAAGFWAWLTGWTEVEGEAARSLRHPSLRGFLLELHPEQEPKGPAKNRLHLDVRLEAGDDPDRVAAGIAERGGRELHFGWGDLPYRHFADPSGNELCLLPSRE